MKIHLHESKNQALGEAVAEFEIPQKYGHPPELVSWEGRTFARHDVASGHTQGDFSFCYMEVQPTVLKAEWLIGT